MSTDNTAPPPGANRLIFEHSPYLLQHAHNPVDWYPWGAEAFARAEAEDKLVFLSIGYSTCHWCHVMERESFEDAEVAGLLKEGFVAVKVDREERPDLDGVYMAVCQALTGSGGWPLTVVLTPEKRPLFAATYLPRRSAFGSVGMLELLPQLSAAWRERREEAAAAAEQIAAAVREAAQQAEPGALQPSALDTAFRTLAGNFDARRGGFGRAPKFPSPHTLMFLLRYWRRTGERRALEIVEKTLQAMRAGGIFDQIGFGFHRYSTDAEWLVPHFEKMLYDQALLVMAYVEAWQATGRPAYRRTAEETIAYVLRDLLAPEGAFYSAEDADSEGVEGRFYVWTEAELREALDEEAELAMLTYGVEAQGNFRDEASGPRTGENILHRRSRGAATGPVGLRGEEEAARLERVRERLLQQRGQRARPARDDKILTDWNGLMIAALARSGRAFGNEQQVHAARRAADFLLTRLRSPRGRLLHRYRDGESGIAAYLDDYAFLTWGLIDLYEATFESRYLGAAVELTDEMIAHHWDDSGKGFYLAAGDAEALLLRQKETYDGALPSGNSAALLNLLRLARLTGRSDFEARATETLEGLGGAVSSAPTAHTWFLAGVDFAFGPSAEVVLVGALEAADLRALAAALDAPFLPNTTVLYVPEGADAAAITVLPEHASAYRSVGGHAAAYVCRDRRCEAPTVGVAQMLRSLGVEEAGEA